MNDALTDIAEIRPKKLFIKTYGCQMNVYDSDRMADALAPHGYEPTPVLEEADLVVLNTCHIREKASEKVFSELGRLAETAARGARIPDRRRRLRGAGRGRGDRAPRQRSVDLVFGPQSYHRLPDLLARVGARRAAWSRPNFPPRTSSRICRPRQRT